MSYLLEGPGTVRGNVVEFGGFAVAAFVMHEFTGWTLVGEVVPPLYALLWVFRFVANRVLDNQERTHFR